MDSGRLRHAAAIQSRMSRNPTKSRRKGMANTDFTSIDEYIATQPKAAQVTLKRMRATIQKAVPQAEEAISYQIPAFKLHGRIMMYFAAWREHYAIYPSSDRLVAAFKNELAPYDLDKGTIRFPIDKPIPMTLIEGIAKFQATLATERALLRASKKR